MANIRKSTTNYYIIADGTALLPSGEQTLTVEFNLSPDFTSPNTGNSEDQITVNISFSDNPDMGQQIIAASNDETKEMDVTVYNAKGIGGTSRPILIGTDNTTKQESYIGLTFAQYDNTYSVSYIVFLSKLAK